MGESKIPWLLYSHGNDFTNKTLCNIASSTHQSSSIPALENKEVLGSSHGWLILKKEKPDAAEFYSLWNPITLESIDFPAFNSKPEHIIISFLLSSPPDDDSSNSMLLLFEAGIPAIFVCRLSKPEWIELRYGNPSNQEWVELSWGKVEIDHLHSPVSYDGKVFATQRRRNLFRVEVNIDNTIFLEPINKIPLCPAPHSHVSSLLNMIECCGELYTVHRTTDDSFGLGGIQGEIIAVHVFKLNFSGMIWEKVDNIDNHAFFLSENSDISCPASVLSSCFPGQQNRIFFTMEEDEYRTLFSYHVGDATLTISRPCPDLPPPWISPVWVTLPTVGTNKGEQEEETLKALMFADNEKNFFPWTDLPILGTNKGEEEEKTLKALMLADNEENFFPWTDLPLDLQHLIAKKFPPFDYMNFRATCRMNCIIAPPISWRTKLAESDQSDQIYSLSPCLIYSPIGKNVCNFLDPNLNGRFLLTTPKVFQDPIVRCCKESWLLMSESQYSEENWLTMFLFNPFTKSTIKLPDMELECFPTIRFSLTSFPHNCYVVCFLNQGKEANFLVTSPGREEWDFLEFLYDTKKFYAVDNVPVYLNNSFYYLSEEEQLGVLTISELGWSWQVWDVKGRPEDFQHNYLVECNGRLLSVYVGHCGKWVKVFKLCECVNDTLFKLEPVHDLGKYVLYLSRLSTLSKVAQVEGTENRIYFERLYRERAIFYSLSTQKFHTGDGIDSLTSYYDTIEPLLCAWIQPRWC